MRAEAAEREVRKLRMDMKKLEGEVRKQRADAYFQRIQKNVQAPRAPSEIMQEKDAGHAVAQESCNEALALRAAAEERAVRAEAEVLRLHTELQVSRVQFALIQEDHLTTTCTPPGENSANVEPVEYAVLPCLSYVCGCLLFFLMRFFMALCCCCRFRPREIQAKSLDPKDQQPEVPIKSFCADKLCLNRS
jgi:hypothetical protein